MSVQTQEKCMSGTVTSVLAIGASGKNAGFVVPELARRGVAVRGMVRDAAATQKVLDQGAGEVVVGDLRNHASLVAAMRGMDAVYYMAPAFFPDESEVGKGVVAAAVEAGVRRFVFSGVIHPMLSRLVNHIAKPPVEEAIVASGMEFTLLQPAVFYQNLAHAWHKVVDTGVLAEPWALSTRHTRVDYRDVAEVAAIACTEDALINGTFELCATEPMNRAQVAALMGDVLGREVNAEVLPVETAVAPFPPARQAAMTRMFAWYDEHGLIGNRLALRTILGREPRTLRAFFEELAAGPAHGH
jgi:uncharacterized protein YbjT (DUF2867 family)